MIVRCYDPPPNPAAPFVDVLWDDEPDRYLVETEWLTEEWFGDHPPQTWQVGTGTYTLLAEREDHDGNPVADYARMPERAA